MQFKLAARCDYCDYCDYCDGWQGAAYTITKQQGKQASERQPCRWEDVNAANRKNNKKVDVTLDNGSVLALCSASKKDIFSVKCYNSKVKGADRKVFLKGLVGIDA